MSLSLSLAVFFIIWWTVLFAVLPFGVRTQDEDGHVVPGTPGSAPARLQLARVFLVTTAVALAMFLVVRWIYLSPAAREGINAIFRNLIGIDLFPM
jgi:predicted secreted protein